MAKKGSFTRHGNGAGAVDGIFAVIKWVQDPMGTARRQRRRRHRRVNDLIAINEIYFLSRQNCRCHGRRRRRVV